MKQKDYNFIGCQYYKQSPYDDGTFFITLLVIIGCQLSPVPLRAGLIFEVKTKLYFYTMKYLLTEVLCLVAFPSFAQQEIRVEDALNHIGDSVKICSKVYDTKSLYRTKGSPTILNVGGPYPNALLRVVLWAEVKEKFDIKLEEFYRDRNICIYGKIQLHKGKPQIIVRSEHQLVEQ